MFEVTDERKNEFRAASGRVYLRETTQGNTIGVQSERMLHLILKYFSVSDESCHEKKIGRYRADILCGEHVYEIQTRRLDRLRAKLSAFLETYDVTVVYPIAASKTLAWIDPEDGSMSKPRKSSVHRTIYDVFYELFFIRDFLCHPRFHFHAVLCDMEEFRSLTGYGKQKKRRAPRMERIPTSLVGEARFDKPGDYACLIPDVLGVRFTTPIFAKETKLSSSAACRAMHVLEALGLLREAGREGHAKVWERIDNDAEAPYDKI